MGRRNWEDGQEIVLEDLNGVAKGVERLLYDRVIFEMLQRTENSFFDDGFRVGFSNANTVNVLKGVGFQTDSAQASPEPKKRLLYRGADVSVNVNPPDASNDRIDIICVKAAIVDELTGTRKKKDAISSSITNESLVIQKDWQAEVIAVAGTPAASPSVPATPTGYIKVAEVLVSAVTGIAGAGAITDTRALMPIGGGIVLNTLGFTRLTAGSAVALTTLINDIEGYLNAGLQDYVDLIQNDSPAGEVGNPAADRQRLFYRDGVLFLKDSGGVKVPVGSGAGGGGGLIWTSPDGEAPIQDEEFLQDVYKFQSGLSQKLAVMIKVPEGFVAGRQISMIIGQYSPSSSNTQLLVANASLIRQNNDPIDTPAASRVSTNTALTNTVANQYRKATLDLTTVTGAIGGFAVQPGDLIFVELSRGSDTDSADVRFIPSSTEVKFG